MGFEEEKEEEEVEEVKEEEDKDFLPPHYCYSPSVKL